MYPYYPDYRCYRWRDYPGYWYRPCYYDMYDRYPYWRDRPYW